MLQMGRVNVCENWEAVLGWTVVELDRRAQSNEEAGMNNPNPNPNPDPNPNPNEEEGMNHEEDVEEKGAKRSIQLAGGNMASPRTLSAEA